MAKKSNQKIKLLYLMKILLENTDDEHGMTLAEISDALGEYGIDAERKTLYDDIDVLCLFGLDIEKRKGKSVTYHVISREFELPELKLLVDAVQSSRFITHKKSNELIKKIEGFASRYEAQELQRQVFVANRIKAMNESIYYAVDYIHDAINRDAKIAFQYFTWDEHKQKKLRHGGKIYLISPWALTWDDENYYMIGYDSDENKIKALPGRQDDKNSADRRKARRRGVLRQFRYGALFKADLRNVRRTRGDGHTPLRK